MEMFKCDMILNLHPDGEVNASPTDRGEVEILSNSQFFPAPDGSWVVVDYIATGDWYVCY